MNIIEEQIQILEAYKAPSYSNYKMSHDTFNQNIDNSISFLRKFPILLKYHTIVKIDNLIAQYDIGIVVYFKKGDSLYIIFDDKNQISYSYKPSSANRTSHSFVWSVGEGAENAAKFLNNINFI